MITVVNRKTHWPDDAKDVWIFRTGSSLGNPFKIGKDGSREEVIAKYEEWLREKLKSGRGPAFIVFSQLAHTARQQDVNLVCYCKPHACHGDVVKKLLEEENV